MPIPVVCPHCSDRFRARDERAGGSENCPQCGDPVPVPEGEPPAPRVIPYARPASAGASDTRPWRRRPNDDTGDRPRRRRRYDDEPPKKSAVPLVLGAVGGAILLLGGGCTLVWFLILAPATEQAARPPAAVPLVNGPAVTAPAVTEQPKLPPPKPVTPVNPNAVPVDPATLPEYPVATVTAAELAKDYAKYKGKWVALKGVATTGTAKAAGEKPEWDNLRLDREWVRLTGAFYSAPPLVLAGGPVEVWGKVSEPADNDPPLVLHECLMPTTAVDVDLMALAKEAETNHGKPPAERWLKAYRVAGVARREGDRWVLRADGADGRYTLWSRVVEDPNLKLQDADQVVLLVNTVQVRTDGSGKDRFVTISAHAARVLSVRR